MKKNKAAVILCIVLCITMLFGCARSDVTAKSDMANTDSQAVQSTKTETSSQETTEMPSDSTMAYATTASEEASKPERKIGEIRLANSTEITSEHRSMIEEAMKHRTDFVTIPIAYIGEKEEDGPNRYFLCNEVPSVKGARGRYVIVSLKENENREILLREISYSEAEAAGEDSDDGWEMSSSGQITPELEKRVADATNEETNVKYIPIVLVEEHKNSPKGYGLLCAVSSDSGVDFRYINVSAENESEKYMEVYDFIAGAE